MTEHNPNVSPYLELPIRNMADVIQLGAAATRLGKKELPKPCPFCGSGPLLPAQIFGRYVIECENDDCWASVSVAGDSPSDAVARWNRRAP